MSTRITTSRKQSRRTPHRACAASVTVVHLAAEFTDADGVVNGWLASHEHCANLFWSRVRFLGAGHATSAEPVEDYWVQDFGG